LELCQLGLVLRQQALQRLAPAHLR
jgi:hypothetical protein